MKRLTPLGALSDNENWSKTFETNEFKGTS